MIKNVSSAKLILLVAMFLLTTGNRAFFFNITTVYPVTINNSLFLISLFIVFICLTNMLLSVLCFRYTIKPVLILVLMISSFSAYFMDTYNVIIDNGVIDNIIKTDIGESLDLFSIKLLLYLLLIGVIPGILVYKTQIVYTNPRQELISRLLSFGLSLVVSMMLILALSNFYASFIREHKTLRFYANPTYFMYALGKFVSNTIRSSSTTLVPIGVDAKIAVSDSAHKLIVLVVGEAARADHFSLNNYTRKTNPYLEQEQVINFTNVWSCGTSTAESLPCMFSFYKRTEFSKDKALATENLLDVLLHAGVQVLWLDNNSDSKGVALRVPFENFKTAENNVTCDLECRDVGMLPRVQSFINAHNTGNIFVVLHQMGNHGPAYYKRYPRNFEKFLPVCKTNQLESCSIAEINNTYDNAILYTDYFLAQIIALLKENSPQFAAAMFYISDHGESLGEYGLYLHGLPYWLAPDEQKHIPMILWFSDNFFSNVTNRELLQRNIAVAYSHDNIPHTILKLFAVQTKIFDDSLAIMEAR